MIERFDLEVFSFPAFTTTSRLIVSLRQRRARRGGACALGFAIAYAEVLLSIVVRRTEAGSEYLEPGPEGSPSVILVAMAVPVVHYCEVRRLRRLVFMGWHVTEAWRRRDRLICNRSTTHMIFPFLAEQTRMYTGPLNAEVSCAWLVR